MTSTPWMNGIDVAVADPIPLGEGDERASVKDLIAEHRDKIDKIKNALNDDPLFDYENKHDDLWILRFYLSHHKTKPAIQAAKDTLQFRKNWNVDEMGDIRDKPPQHVQEGLVYEHFQQRCPNNAVVLGLPDKQRGAIMFITFKEINPKADLSPECWDYTFIYASEWLFQWMDYITRTTGRLTKSIRIIDMTGMSLSDMRERKPKGRDAKIFTIMEDCYPQLLQSIFLVNPPALLSVIGAIFRLILPKRILDKFNVISPKTNENDKRYLLHHMSIEDLPENLGGLNAVPPGEWKMQ